jgi:hypothetical protein
VALASTVEGQPSLAGHEFLSNAGLQPAFTGQVWAPFADPVQETGKEDGREAAEHDRRQHLGEQHPLLLMKDLGITDRQRDGPLADAACHDRDHDVEKGVVGAEPEHHADERADGAGDHRTDSERDEDL